MTQIAAPWGPDTWAEKAMGDRMKNKYGNKCKATPCERTVGEKGAKGFCAVHYNRFRRGIDMSISADRDLRGAKPGKSSSRENNNNWRGGRTITAGYIKILQPEHHRSDPYGYVLEHIVIAESILGKPLPPKAEIHHVNGTRHDNTPSNLVICQDRAYHLLLHRREKALRERREANY